MYGGSNKLGRGRGGGPVKRNNIHSTFQPSSVQRPSSTPGGGRLSAGGGHHNRGTTPVSSATVSTADETFSLVRNNPLNFGMLIRLSPVLIDEIKRLEAQGGAAKIKFDASPNNPAGNVIDVGGKEFRFTWSQETGDLCDIYEERRSGDDGNGLLVESGGAWRKLNVQRELDESFKNHVKMRTVEAERKHKSRKAIVLDHGNPSMKNQMKALAAAEVNNTWRSSYKQKKEPPFKKMRAETSSVFPPKSAGKAGLSSATPSKVRQSASPLLSTPEQSGAPLSPLGNSSFTKIHANIEDSIPTQATKENPGASEKDLPNRATAGAAQDKVGSKGKFGNAPADLQGMLISLLREKPQGMNLKALEKAIGDKVPKSAKQIEPILRKIAVFQAPGRCILKPEVELESFKKPFPESASSPDNNCQDTEVTPPGPSFPSKADVKELEEQAHLISGTFEEIDTSEKIDIEQKIDIEHRSPDVFGEKKVSDNSEGPAVSSSLSGSDSDSDSDSSDSGSDSGSPSRSPVGSGSGSSSDSESDASSNNSKEGSDEDVDIMSDDDKEPKHELPQSDLGLSKHPIPWTAPEVGYEHNLVDEKDEGHGSDLVEIEKELHEDNQEVDKALVTSSFPDKDGEVSNRLERQESEVRGGSLYSENLVKDDSKNEQSDNSERLISQSKFKRGSNQKLLDENLEHTKRSKSGNWTRPVFSVGKNSFSSESPQNLSPDRPTEGPYKGSTTQATVRDVTDYGYKKSYNQEGTGNSTSVSPRSDKKCIDLNARVKAPAMEKTDRHVEGLDLGSTAKFSERGSQGLDGFPPPQKDKLKKELRNEDGHTNEKRQPKSSRLGGRDKHSDSNPRKQGALVGKFKESGLVSASEIKNSPMDNYKTDMNRSPVINGRGIPLRRELSDLEMGELRENLHEETPWAQKRFERNSSFKQSENRSSSDYWNLDAGKVKPAGRTSLDSAKASPPQSGIGMSSNPESLSRKKTPEDHVKDLTRSHHKSIQLQNQSLSRVDHAEAAAQHSKPAEMNNKGRHNEAGANLGIGPEGHLDSQRKVPVGAPQKNEKRVVPLSTRENRRSKSNDLGERQNNFSLLESNNGGKKGTEPSPDDDCSSYSKYEKEEPEMKGPIRDLSQYNEYVQEYREKYDSYHELNKILESYRSEFLSLGRDLELAKGRDSDRYNKILGKLMESYRQCGSKHKRLKKIFVVLHHELQNLKEMMKDFAEKHTKG